MPWVSNINDLAKHKDKMDEQEISEFEFEYGLIESLFSIFVHAGDREGLVTLLSTRCLPLYRGHLNIENMHWCSGDSGMCVQAIRGSWTRQS
jgi:hypothetical protein